MKSAVFYGKHDLRVEDSTKPAVGKRDVLINVKACGVCGTDVHIYEGDKVQPTLPRPRSLVMSLRALSRPWAATSLALNRAIACASTQTIPAAAANPVATESTTTASI